MDSVLQTVTLIATGLGMVHEMRRLATSLESSNRLLTKISESRVQVDTSRIEASLLESNRLLADLQCVRTRP